MFVAATETRHCREKRTERENRLACEGEEASARGAGGARGPRTVRSVVTRAEYRCVWLVRSLLPRSSSSSSSLFPSLPPVHRAPLSPSPSPEGNRETDFSVVEGGQWSTIVEGVFSHRVAERFRGGGGGREGREVTRKRPREREGGEAEISASSVSLFDVATCPKLGGHRRTLSGSGRHQRKCLGIASFPPPLPLVPLLPRPAPLFIPYSALYTGSRPGFLCRGSKRGRK